MRAYKFRRWLGLGGVESYTLIRPVGAPPTQAFEGRLFSREEKEESPQLRATTSSMCRSSPAGSS